MEVGTTTGVSASESRQSSAPAAAPEGASPEASAALLVQAALRQDSHVNFPQITEICDRLEVHPSEVEEAVVVLTRALCDRRGLLLTKLKALTISNEMMYNPQAVSAFRAVKGLADALAVLREVRGAEPGDVTAENVRMLANEIERVCFASAVSSKTMTPPRTGGTQLERLEKARQRAQEIFELSQQKAMKFMKRAERAVEKNVNMMLQEAEQTFGGVSVDTVGPDVRTQRERQVQLQRQQLEQWDIMALEERQLQWALGASLAEFQCQQASTTTPQPSVGSPSVSKINKTCIAELHLSMDEVSSRIEHAEEREQAAQLELKSESARASAAAVEDSELLRRLEESSRVVSRLTAQWAEADAQLGRATQRSEELEWKLAETGEELFADGPVGARAAASSLRAHLREREGLQTAQDTAVQSAAVTSPAVSVEAPDEVVAETQAASSPAKTPPGPGADEV